MIGDHPAVLQRGKQHSARGDQGARADLDVGDGLGLHLAGGDVIGGDRAVIEVAGVGALGEFFAVEPAVRPLECRGRAVLREAALRPDAIGDVFDRVVGGRLVRDAAVPGRAGAFHHVGTIRAHRTRLGNVFLHVEAWIVLDRLAGLGIEPLGPVQLVHVLAALDETAVVAIERIVEAVAPKVADHLAVLAVDVDVEQHVDADLVIVP